VQTRPGSGAEPEKEPAEGEERDPFTPKVRPDDESAAPQGADDSAEPAEEDAEKPENTEEPAGGEPDAAAEPAMAEGTASSEPAAEDDSGPSEPDEEPAADEPAPRRRSESGEQPAADDPALRRRSEPTEQPASDHPASDEPATDEPPRRRTPAGPPPKRRIGPPPGDPRRVSGRPPAAHASSEPGPRRRPLSGPAAHAADAPRRRPAPEPKQQAPRPARQAAVRATPDPVSLGRRRLFAALWPPRLSRNQVVVGVLLAALGAALAIQVHATNTSDQFLRAARSDDLVHILDDVTARGQRLDAELRDLQTQNAAIQNSADKAQAALAQAQQKAKDLQILAGAVRAKGPGITMTITDAQRQLKSATLLNAMEELRAAGAEVIQIGDVRVVVSSSFVDTPEGGIALDGHTLSQPYIYKVIGDPNTLQPAMQIPGGVVASVRSVPGASATIVSGQVQVDAVAPQPSADFAKAG
jgi:uncharacterized protein YlxW (UPF0749 family)